MDKNKHDAFMAYMMAITLHRRVKDHSAVLDTANWLNTTGHIRFAQRLYNVIGNNK